MWAICYINAWTPTPGLVNGCPGLVAFLTEEHLASYLWQRGKRLFSTFPNHSPNPFSSLFFFFLFYCLLFFVDFFFFISNFGSLWKANKRAHFVSENKYLTVQWKTDSFRSINLPSVVAPLKSEQAGTRWALRVWLPVREEHRELTAAQFVCVCVPLRGEDKGRRGNDVETMAV